MRASHEIHVAIFIRLVLLTLFSDTQNIVTHRLALEFWRGDGCWLHHPEARPHEKNRVNPKAKVTVFNQRWWMEKATGLPVITRPFRRAGVAPTIKSTRAPCAGSVRTTNQPTPNSNRRVTCQLVCRRVDKWHTCQAIICDATDREREREYTPGAAAAGAAGAAASAAGAAGAAAHCTRTKSRGEDG